MDGRERARGRSCLLLLALPLGWGVLPACAGPDGPALRVPLRVTNAVPGPCACDCLVPGHPDPASTAPESLFAGVRELSVESLVDQVIARNPSVPEATAAWEAARARYPQVTSLDDPLFGTTLAPAAVGREPANGYRFEVFQRYPWPGKRQLRGESAAAEASAAGRDVENVRLQLVESARDAFYEFYLVLRALEVNERALDILRRALKTAESRVATGKGEQQDVLQLRVEIGRQRDRGLALDRQQQVAVARINTLLHLPPDLPLPPPPKEIKVDGELPDPRELRSAALAQRLDLLQLRDRIAAAQASLQLAYKEYYPDFDVMAAYDAFWESKDQRPQLAVRVNLPIRLARRDGAVKEAQARLAQLQAQLIRQADQAGFEVQQAYEQWRESLRTVRLFEKDVLPDARRNVRSAEPAYTTGRISLLILLEAQRSLVNLEDRYYEATAEFFRRRTALQRSLTGSPAATPLPMPAQRPMPGQSGAPTGMGRQ
jgi:cobalt-zinc-cadmium efflux system outer membrane protein